MAKKETKQSKSRVFSLMGYHASGSYDHWQEEGVFELGKDLTFRDAAGMSHSDPEAVKDVLFLDVNARTSLGGYPEEIIHRVPFKKYRELGDPWKIKVGYSPDGEVVSVDRAMGGIWAMTDSERAARIVAYVTRKDINHFPLEKTDVWEITSGSLPNKSGDYRGRAYNPSGCRINVRGRYLDAVAHAVTRDWFYANYDWRNSPRHKDGGVIIPFLANSVQGAANLEAVLREQEKLKRDSRKSE